MKKDWLGSVKHMRTGRGRGRFGLVTAVAVVLFTAPLSLTVASAAEPRHSRTVAPDVVAPTVSILADPARPTGNNGWYRKAVQLSFAVHDDIDPEPLLEISVNGEEFVRYMGDIGVSNGSNTVDVRVTDDAGNVGVAKWTGKVDQTLPVITAERSGNWLVLSAADNPSGLKSVRYRYLLRVGGRSVLGPWTEYRRPVLLVLDRVVSVQYLAEDIAGNISLP